GDLLRLLLGKSQSVAQFGGEGCLGVQIEGYVQQRAGGAHAQLVGEATECAELGQCGGDVRTPHVAAVDHTRYQTGAAQARDLGQIVDAFLVGDQVQTDRLDRGVLEHTQGAGTDRPEVGRDQK